MSSFRLPVTESRILVSRSRRARRNSGELPSPNIRSNTTCGLISIGSGRVGRLPGDGVGIDAAVALAAVRGIRPRVLEAELQGGQQGIAANLPGDDLVDGSADLNVGARCLAWLDCCQVGGRHEVIGSRNTGRILGRLRPHSAGQNHVFAERLERLIHVGEI